MTASAVALLVVTDGRDEYLDRCVASLVERVGGPINERWMFDDTGDDLYRSRLAERYPMFRHINGGYRRGFGGAINRAWTTLSERSRVDWVFHVEADFVFTVDVDLDEMIGVLAARAALVQMALRRQPWNDDEQAAGGVVEQHPAAYEDCSDGRGRAWLEHRLFFTTNPCLYRRSLCSMGWPLVPQSEGQFTHFLMREGSPDASGADVRFGLWGSRDSGTWVEHIGRDRSGVGY